MRFATAAAASLLTVLTASAQQPAPETMPTFDTVSIKPNRSSDTSRSLQNNPGYYRATNAPILSLIVAAFNVAVDSVLNAPDWVRTERFDVEARAAEADTDKLRT